jgi:hypothetical protein
MTERGDPAAEEDDVSRYCSRVTVFIFLFGLETSNCNSVLRMHSSVQQLSEQRLTLSERRLGPP